MNIDTPIDGIRFICSSYDSEAFIIVDSGEPEMTKVFDHKYPMGYNKVDEPYVNQSLTRLWFNGTEKDWETAEENYWRLIKPNNLQLERKMEEVTFDDFKKMTTEQFFDFLCYEYFPGRYTNKSRLSRYIKCFNKYKTENRMSDLARIKDQMESFDTKDVERGLKIVTEIPGLGPSGASGLLAILFPLDFGSVDQFVPKTLESIEGLPEHGIIVKMKSESLQIKDGKVLINIMRAKSVELNDKFDSEKWTPRVIDKALWGHRD